MGQEKIQILQKYGKNYNAFCQKFCLSDRLSDQSYREVCAIVRQKQDEQFVIDEEMQTEEESVETQEETTPTTRRLQPTPPKASTHNDVLSTFSNLSTEDISQNFNNNNTSN